LAPTAISARAALSSRIISFVMALLSCLDAILAILGHG